jgi:putative phage-type endonuclease
MYHQETISVDGLIDRTYIKKNGAIQANQLRKMLNTVFYQPVSLDYIQARIDKYQTWQQQLERIKQEKRIEQRTPEWYDARKTLITASDFAQALGEGKFGNQKQFFQKKCGYEEEKFNPSIPPLKWGTMFEPIATAIYSARNHVEVFEFGLLRHPNVSYFGASPDGINELGVMLEIKCPYKRKINGCVPAQYYYQIQGQLDVCGLDECDYLECEFALFDSFEEFMDFKDETECGIIAEMSSDVGYTYEYSDIQCAKQMDKVAVFETFKEHADVNAKFHFWRLNVFNVVRVYKDETFVKEKLAELSQVWSKIEAYRADKDLYTLEVGKARATSRTVPAIQGYSFVDI